MKTIFLTTIAFMTGVTITAAYTHPEHKVREYIHVAYDMGRSECPDDMHCIGDDIGLVRLTVADIEGVI